MARVMVMVRVRVRMRVRLRLRLRLMERTSAPSTAIVWSALSEAVRLRKMTGRGRLTGMGSLRKKTKNAGRGRLAGRGVLRKTKKKCREG